MEKRQVHIEKKTCCRPKIDGMGDINEIGRCSRGQELRGCWVAVPARYLSDLELDIRRSGLVSEVRDHGGSIDCRVG